jgi:ABC-2 type transport system ATP-binding protein
LEVLKGIDLEIPQGSIFALLGPNGAGKTTTIRILATLLGFQGGTVEVLGHQLPREKAQVRRRISLAGQYASMDEDLTGRENLTLLGRLLGFTKPQSAQRAGQILKAFNLEDAASRLVKNYSGGMRRKLDIAASLIVTPDLLFLDEPTTGLDPHNRNEIWDVIRRLAEAGTTILLTTQYLDEADHLAQQIAVINHGRVIAQGTPSQLKKTVGEGILHLHFEHQETADQAAVALHHILLEHGIDSEIRRHSDPRTMQVAMPHTETAVLVLQSLHKAQLEPVEFSLGHPSLDEVFLALTGRPAEEPSETPDEATTLKSPPKKEVKNVN